MREILKREDVKKEYTWAIEDLFESKEAWEEALSELIAKAESLKTCKGTLNTAKGLYAFLSGMDEMNQLLDNVYCYAMYCNDVDTTNANAQSMVNKVQSAAVEIDQNLAFANVEIMALNETQLKWFYLEVPGLSVYKRYINDLRRSENHILSEAEERILAASGEMANAPTRIASMLMNADLKFENAIDSEGNSYPLSNGSFLSLLSSKDRELRKSAFENLYKAYGSMKNTSASILASQMKQLKFNADMRNFESSLQAALHNNNVEEQVYPNLIKAVHEDIHILHKYMRLRKKIMGVKELHMYDLYTSLLPECDLKVPFEEAKANVINSVAVLGKEYQDVVKKAFESRWIDIYENVGKRAGAYSSGSKVHPFILLNYEDTINSQFTTAHEMGHAMHSYLSNKHQPAIDSEYVIFVAEVASTCNEALLMNYLRSKTEDKKVKAYLINYFLEQFRTTLYRQTLFAEFELKMNEMVAHGENLSAEALCKLYHDLNAFYYGEDVVIDASIDLEWARVPHFYMNYYVYQYATGFSAAMALSNKILNKEENAVDNYLNFLKGGCSKSPIELLRGAGVDMASEAPIHEALSLFDSLIDELDVLMEEIK